MITKPFNKTFISLLLYYFFYPKYVLLSLLKFLFIKGTLYFLSVIISYFICHSDCQLNIINFINFFRSSLSVAFIKRFLFLCYFNIITNGKFWCNGLSPNSGYKFLDSLFLFSLRLASFRVIFIDE